MDGTNELSGFENDLLAHDSRCQQTMIDTLQQELYEVKRAMTRSEFMKSEMEHEIERLQLELSKVEKQNTLSIQNKESELTSMWTERLNNLQVQLHDEQEEHREETAKLLIQIEELKKNTKSHDETINYDDIRNKMSAIVTENEDLKNTVEELKTQLLSSSSENDFLNMKVNTLEKELEDTRSHLKSSKELMKTLNENLKDLQDDKAMIESELTALKVGPIGDIQRGNSLFAEVEDKRQGMEAKMTILKNKYAQAKRIIGTKNAEISKLKSENCLMQRFWPDEEKKSKTENSKLLEEYRKRIDTLMHQVNDLKKRPESPQIVTISPNDMCKLDWIHLYVDDVRAEIRKLQGQLEENSVEKLFLAEELHNTQQEMRGLRVQALKDKAAYQQLQVEYDKIKGSESVMVAEEGEKEREVVVESNVKSKEKVQRSVRFADAPDQ